MMKKIVAIILSSSLILPYPPLMTKAASNSEIEEKTLIVALDDRPVNVDYPILLLNDNSLAISDSLYKEELREKVDVIKKEISEKNYTSLIISLDNLLYDGLMESRHVTESLNAKEKEVIVDFFEFLKTSKIQTQVFTSAQRVTNSIYSDADLTMYNETLKANRTLTSYHFNSNTTDIYAPSEGMLAYYEHRANKLQDTTFLIEAIQPLVDAFYIGQDDTQNSGIQKFESHYLRSLKNSEDVIFLNGTDEFISMLVYKIHSTEERQKVYLKITDENNINENLNFEGTNLEELLEEKKKLFNIDFVSLNEAKYIWIINNSDTFNPDILKLFKVDKKVILSDLNTSDYKKQIIDDILEANPNNLNNLVSYSSWNTASNLMGLSLSQGFLSEQNDNNRLLIEKRILKDFLYKNILQYEVREKFPEVLTRQYNINNSSINAYLKDEMNMFLKYDLKSSTRVEEVILPWNRLFEVTIKLSDN